MAAFAQARDTATFASIVADTKEERVHKQVKEVGSVPNGEDEGEGQEGGEDDENEDDSNDNEEEDDDDVDEWQEDTTSRTSLDDEHSLDGSDPDKKVASMAENPFDSESSRVLFEALDELQSCNAKKYINSPQLVIVGAQSAGKSSLLQSLTGIPFPVGKGCCTRFATRIVSRRTDLGSPNEVHISITPPEFAVSHFDYAPNNSYEEFKRSRRSINETDFVDIIEEVSTKYLDIRPGMGVGNKNFATEVLKIEISGPNRSYFSILDIPGVVTNAYKIKDSEMKGIKDLVAEYMTQPDNLVICVADASVDLETQTIFQMARKYVDEARLIGVYTKCDRSDNKDAIVDVVNGREDSGVGQLTQHGWFVVRNKTEKDRNDPKFDLDKTEAELFETSPWSEISPTRKGSAMLKKYLGRLLSDKIRIAFPQISKSLAEQLKHATMCMERLGKPRVSEDQRKAYLADIAQRYQNRAKEALERPWLLDGVQCRVRTRVKQENEQFNKIMRSEGHQYSFENHNLETDEYLEMIKGIIYKDEDTPSATKSQKPKGKQPQDSGIQSSSAGVLTEEQLRCKIREEVEICSSTELPGMVHPDVVHRLYACQTQKWWSYAESHLQTTSVYLMDSAEKILRSVCPAEGSTAVLHAELLALLRKFHDDSLQRSLRALKKYCNGDRSKLLQTTDPGFLHKLETLRTVRMASGIRAALDISAQNEQQALPIEALSSLLFSQCHHSTMGNTINDVHDTLKVYYEFSLQSFIRHITNTIMEDFVTDPNGSLRGLSSTYIQSLDASEIDRLGGENREVVEERELLRARIDTLRSAEQTARLAMLKATNLS